MSTNLGTTSNNEAEEGQEGKNSLAARRGSKKKPAKFEDILQMAGDHGRWQITIFLITWIEGILIGCHHLSSSFLGASMDHWCNLGHVQALQDVPWTLEQKKQYALPYNEESMKYASCEMYDLRDIRIPVNFDVAMQLRPNLTTVECQQLNVPMKEQFQFDTSEGITSIVTDWTLVCERLHLLSHVQASYMGGVFVGCLVFGWASDKFGRRLTMLVAAAIQIVSSIATSFSVNYIIFILLRFLVAFSVSGVFECGFVLVTEVCGPRFRAPFGILTQLPFGVGATLLPLIAYFIRDWVTLQLSISIPSLALCVYYWGIPESPRWLISQGRFEEALKILKGGAKINNMVLPPDNEILELMERVKDLEENLAEEEVQVGPAQASPGSGEAAGASMDTMKEKLYEVFKELILLVKTPEMRKRTLNVFFSWMVVAMVYYGLSFNSKNLGASRYISVFVSGFVEVPAVVAILPLLAKLGRMKCYCGTFIGGGICCTIVAILSFILAPGDKVWLPVSVAMVGKFLISMAFAIAYLYTAELFPTNVRNVAVGAASTFARIGSMSAPYIVDLLGAIHAGIPVIIFGIVSMMAGLLSLMLPETLNKKLPESVAEVERSAKKKHRDVDDFDDLRGGTATELNKMTAGNNDDA